MIPRPHLGRIVPPAQTLIPRLCPAVDRARFVFGKLSARVGKRASWGVNLDMTSPLLPRPALALRRLCVVVCLQFASAILWAAVPVVVPSHEKGDRSTAPSPNIVYILCDDLGYGDVHCLNPQRGKIATPCMDRMAGQGLTFTEAHSSSAVCTPSRYSILTGRYNWRSPLQSGVLNGFSPPLIAPGRLTVAKLLKQHGYATACIGKWHLGMGVSRAHLDAPIDKGPTARGFDHFFGISASADMPPYAFIENDRFTEAPTTVKELYQGRRGPAAPNFAVVDVLPTLVRKCKAWIDLHQAQPFFLYLPLNSPHTPLAPTREWKGKSGLGNYGDFVMETDWALGEILQAVDTAGLTNNTLVIFTSDNGCAPYVGTLSTDDPALTYQGAGAVASLEALGHFPSEWRRGYKSDVWDGGHRIPFIARWPGKITPGTTSDQLICLSDLMATCADILATKLPDNAGEDSVSILPVLLGSKLEKPLREAVVHHSAAGSFAIRQGQWKLDLCPGSGGWGVPNDFEAKSAGLPAVQLYDMVVDGGETRNVQAEHPEIVARLRSLLEKIIAEGRSTPGPKIPNDVSVTIDKPNTKSRAR